MGIPIHHAVAPRSSLEFQLESAGLVALPIMRAYTAAVYFAFRGEARLDS
jgi:hypothetical protein